MINDHQAIARGFRPDGDDPVLYRWARELDGYSLTIQHRAGVSIAHADALSRKPCSPHRRVSEGSVWADEYQRDELLEFLRALVKGESPLPPGSVEPVSGASGVNRGAVGADRPQRHFSRGGIFELTTKKTDFCSKISS